MDTPWEPLGSPRGTVTSRRALRRLIDLDNAVSGNRITMIFEDSRKRVLIGTSDGGLNIFDPETERFTTLTHKEGLHDDMICSVVEDRSERLWIVTRTGISELDATNRVLRTYDHSSGIRVQEFSPAAAFVTPDNTIWVGGDNGMVSFNPDDLQVNTYAPPVVITSVSVNNRPIGPDFGQVLRLKHDEGNLTFSFRALNYIYPERNAYAYKLEGADNEWREVGSVREVNYANLAPGHYHFRVRGSNNDGIWSEKDAGLDIEIASPAWLRWWAVLIYLLLAATVLVSIALFSLIFYHWCLHAKRTEALTQGDGPCAICSMYCDSARNTSRPHLSFAMYCALCSLKSSSSAASRASIQHALYRLMGSHRHAAPYSCSSRYSITSNCSAPTVPIIFRPLNWFTNSCATPSSISWSIPFASCFDFIGSAFSMYLNSSGENDGIPLKCSFSPSVSVSPILKFPVSCSPTMSPGYASSMIDFFDAMKAVGVENLSVLPSPTW